MDEMSLAARKGRSEEQPTSNEKPLITVITPCLDSVGTIGENLQSVIAVRQELYANGLELEHLIVEGGSRDGTSELVEEHTNKHPFCKTISGITGGPYPAMNAGLLQSTGAYTHVLNADDYIMRPKAYAALAIRAQHLKAEALLCSIAYFRRPKDYITRLWIAEETGEDSRIWHQKLRKGLHYPHPGFIAKTELYRDELFDEAYTLSADYKLMQTLLMRLNPACDVLVDPRPLVAMAEGGATGRLRGRLEGWQQLASINRELGIQTSAHARYSEKIRQMLQMWANPAFINRLNEE
jgi:glycosyltransferase involved in cell wall biosynthesis